MRVGQSKKSTVDGERVLSERRVLDLNLYSKESDVVYFMTTGQIHIRKQPIIWITKLMVWMLYLYLDNDDDQYYTDGYGIVVNL